MATLTWVLADLKSGDFIEELPLRAMGLERKVSTKSTSSATLDVNDPSCPPNWQYLVDGMRSMIVPVLDDVPLAGFLVDQVPIGAPTSTFMLSSLEACLEGAYCGTHDFSEGVDDEGIALATLAAEFASDFGFEVEVTPTGHTGDHSYSEYEDRTLLAAFSETSAQENGPEWTTRIRWEDDTHRRFIKTLVIAPQVGRRIESLVIDDQHITSRVRTRSWTRRALEVVATGDGVGESRPMSPPVVDTDSLDRGVPRWRGRVAAPGADTDDSLIRAAASALQRRRYGIQTWAIEMALTEPSAPRLGRDFDAGDTVTVDLRPTAYDRVEWRGPARIIGWRADFEARTATRVTPVFWDPTEGEDA